MHSVVLDVSSYFAGMMINSGSTEIAISAAVRSKDLEPTLSSSSWILAAIYSNQLYLLKLIISVVPGSPANDPSKNIAYICGAGSGTATYTKNKALDMTYINLAWASSTSVPYASAANAPGFGLSTLSYTVVTTSYPTRVPTSTPSSSTPSASPSTSFYLSYNTSKSLISLKRNIYTSR